MDSAHVGGSVPDRNSHRAGAKLGNCTLHLYAFLKVYAPGSLAKMENRRPYGGNFSGTYSTHYLLRNTCTSVWHIRSLVFRPTADASSANRVARI